LPARTVPEGSGWNISHVCSGKYTRRLSPGRVLELDLDQPAILVRHLEHRAGFQFHEAGQKYLRDLTDAGVVGVDVVVEELAPVGDALFQFADAVLALSCG
jgi:hypothetical protein